MGGLTGEEGRPARRAERKIHEAVLERHALRRKRLNVRQIGRGAGVFLIVGENDDDVRRRHGAGEERERDEKSAKKSAHVSCPAVPNVAPSDAVRLAGRAPPTAVFFRAEIVPASLGPTAPRSSRAPNAASCLEFGGVRQIAVALSKAPSRPHRRRS